MPFFRPGPGPYALAIAMTGIRLGERLLQVGAGTPGLFGALAVKPGLSGHAAGVADDPAGAAALEQAGAQAGALVDVQVAAPGSLPFDTESFDVIVVDATVGATEKNVAWLPEALRVLRAGGRLIVAERTGAVRLWGVFQVRGSSTSGQPVAQALQTAGYRPVRTIAERDGWRFTEGLKPRTS